MKIASFVAGLSAWGTLAVLLLPSAAAECAQGVPANSAALEQQAALADQYRRAHLFATGFGTRVAVIDTGVSTHPRLPNLASGGSVIADPESGDALEDCDAHGTAVAGIIAARWDQDEIVGVAPDAGIVSIKQMSDHRDAGGTLATLSQAIDVAVDQGVDVINISVVSCIPQGPFSVDLSGLEAALNRAEEANIVVVSAAGNQDAQCTPDSLIVPAAMPTVVSVAALSDPYHHAAYSLDSSQPQVAAPGKVFAALSNSGGFLASGIEQSASSVQSFEGTSFAAPLISGTFALLRQKYPTATARELRELVISSVDPTSGAIDIPRVLDYRLPEDEASLVSSTPPAAHAIAAPRRHQSSIPLASSWLVVLASLILVLTIAYSRMRT
ncbi:S8 family serine peptidase [Corynebacterium sp. ES2715-CONJ3]|uniref:S8 family serine peptidase n=1 Tax=Corynebacterium sp. ES2715-CONJ3 TaxID=2974028 RepID=UPI0021672748|nr:S8 family serine peptidase [Corynebacterium sp. ES2715-CONJ3]MCS4491400.1 S8 family serine peptidase [Corynebacterium sp. ES2715-CONJ3]